MGSELLGTESLASHSQVLRSSSLPSHLFISVCLRRDVAVVDLQWSEFFKTLPKTVCCVEVINEQQHRKFLMTHIG